jgi:murein DD-endopeptidase MepM/ murein hydrolase activator NlpD
LATETRMTASAAMLCPIACPSCKGPVDVKSRHVSIDGTAVKIYCSEACLHARDAVSLTAQIETPRRRRAGWWIVGGLVAGTTGFALWSYENGDDAEQPGVGSAIRAFVEAGQPPPPTAPAPIAHKPAADQPSPEEAEDAALVQELARDAWIHPLAGPDRRMPRNHTGAFGALRPGERPPECISGHCGVDIGHVWGEPVHAVHDGVVEWVNRGPNEEHGGIFVKIAHRGGALYSWYFHLAAVPRWVQPGVKVRAGQVVGLLGDTGVFHSEPHLHFSLSVKPSKFAHERYLDPEPLIAIWPLWIANDNTSNGHMSLASAPGVPVREHDQWKAKQPEVVPASAESAPTPTPTPTSVITPEPAVSSSAPSSALGSPAAP